MLRALLRPSYVLRAAFLSSSSSSFSAAFHNEAASEAAMAANSLTSAAAASLLLSQNSQSHDSAAATIHMQQTDAAAAGGGGAAAQDHANALSILEESNTSGRNGDVDCVMDGLSSLHLGEVTVVRENAPFSSETTMATAAASLPRRTEGDNGTGARRPVITKARRIRLASAASQAAEVLQAVSSPATALLLSQRVQQLQAEEALLNASLQRLKAERNLATVRHTCGEELNNYRHGVQQREQRVVRAAMTAGMPSQDAVVSYSQESGGSARGDTLQTLVEADLLGMPATADAEAAAAARKAGPRSGRASHTAPTVTSAKKRLLRRGAIAADIYKAKAPPKPHTPAETKPEASKSKKASPAKQAAVKARAAKPRRQPAAARKHAANEKAKASLCMKVKSSAAAAKAVEAKKTHKSKKAKAKTPAAAAAAAVRGAARRQKAKVTAAAAMKPSRKPSQMSAKKQRKPLAPKRKSAPAPPAAKAKSKTTKAVATKKR
ncbi:histone h1-like protein [Leishmania guyanensis]